MRSLGRGRARALAMMLGVAGLLVASNGPVGAATAVSRTYTSDADFDQGTSNNVVRTTPNQLQLDDTTTAFPFIWVALSARGTIAKIDTATGAILGEYSSTSDGDSSHNPSRTTVGNDGSVWAGNRNQSSVIHVGLVEAGQCVDRNSNGVIETSTGYGNVLPWPGGSSGASAPATDATDECILHYVDTAGGDARHVSVDPAGNLWIGSFNGGRNFQKIDSATGAIVPGTARTFSCGGYGGLVDGNGILWSASSGGSVLRWDPNAPDVVDVNPRCISVLNNYGIARDSQNNIWISTYSNSGIIKLSPDGTKIGEFTTGINFTQGLAVDGNDHVWLSSSLSGGANRIGHLKNDGTLVGYVTGAGSGSTGVSVDAAGKIWTANIDSSDATRIDPNGGEFGPDGVTRIGAFDLTVPLPGASPYNYSDMTGSALTGKPKSGTWSVVYDSGQADADWETLSWTADVPGNSSLIVNIASSNDGTTFGPAEAVTSGGAVSVADGRYLRVSVVFNRATTAGEPSPVLYDLTINTPPAPVTAAPTTAAPTTTIAAAFPPSPAAPNATVAPSAPISGILPATGSTSDSLVVMAIVSLLLGGGIAAVARQRPPRRT